VAFGLVMAGLLGIVCGLAILIEPSFADRITGWRGPRWPAACGVAAGITLLLAGFADRLPSEFHIVAFAAAVLAGGAALLIAQVGRSAVKEPEEDVSR
jgi:hypothetical protein